MLQNLISFVLYILFYCLLNFAEGEDLADDTRDIVIPVSIAVGGLILLLILLAVCILCWRKYVNQSGIQTFLKHNLKTVF